MTREEALKWIEDFEKEAKELNFPLPPMLEFVQDMANAHNISFENCAWALKNYFSVGMETRPIREKSKTKSCEHCKYFVEIPQKLSLGEPQGYFRFCVISGLHEPIDDSWELEHEICFCKKGGRQWLKD